MMSNLEQHLEALVRRGDLQDVGVVDPTQRNGTQLFTLQDSRHRTYILSTV